MSLDKRKQQISDLLKKNGTVKVTELSELFEVSEVTIRNYLTDMEKKGLLTRVHGGAVSSYKPYYSMNLTQRLESNQLEKTKIAEKIATFIKPNDTIMLNAGTTTLLAFRAFPQEYNLNIVTNSISIALEASNNPNYNIVLVGGSVNSKYQFTFGSDAVKQINSYHADKLILSVDGIDASHGLTTYYDKEVEIDMAMLRRSDRCIIAADHTKINRCAFAIISDISVADYLITNESANKDFFSQLKTENMEICFC